VRLFAAPRLIHLTVLGLLVANSSYVEAYIRGEGITFYIGERRVTPEEFVAFGEAYWDAFAKRAESRCTSAE
jgi:hypothetical protein